MTCLRSRLLGAVLGGVMQQPGSLLSNLTSRFSPALQPTHSRELLFILQEIQAVSILKLVKQSTIGRIQTILQEIQNVSILKFHQIFHQYEKTLNQKFSKNFTIVTTRLNLMQKFFYLLHVLRNFIFYFGFFKKSILQFSPKNFRDSL